MRKVLRIFFFFLFITIIWTFVMMSMKREVRVELTCGPGTTSVVMIMFAIVRNFNRFNIQSKVFKSLFTPSPSLLIIIFVFFFKYNQIFIKYFLSWKKINSFKSMFKIPLLLCNYSYNRLLITDIILFFSKIICFINFSHQSIISSFFHYFQCKEFFIPL
jgi:hypothetical protein